MPLKMKDVSDLAICFSAINVNQTLGLTVFADGTRITANVTGLGWSFIDQGGVIGFMRIINFTIAESMYPPSGYDW